MHAVNRPACRRPAAGLAAAFALLGAMTAVQARPPEFPAPEGATVSQIADSMTVLGRQMSVRGFVTEDTVEEVVEYYQELWADPPVAGAPGVAYEPDVIAPWHLLTRVEEGYVMTVQVQPARGEGSFGYLALGRLPEPGEKPQEPPAPPSMQGSVVESNVTSEDPGKSASTAMLTNADSLDSNVAFYRNHYGAWRKDIDQAMAHDRMHALSFTRGREQVVITIKADDRGGSQIVINSVQHDLL